MRILQISSANSIGGGERHVADLSRSLAERGHEVFFALRPSSPVRPMLERFADQRFYFSKMRNAADVVSARQIAKFALSVGADIIHAHIARDFTIAAEASRVTDIPYVLTRHTLFPMSRVHRLLLKRAAGVIAPSRSVYDALVRDMVFPVNKISLIYNGVDTGHFTIPKRTNIDRFTVVSIGHLAPIKGFDIFIRAAAIVMERRPEIRFVIVGEDKTRDGRNRREITQLIAELSVNVEVAGWVDDTREAYREMDVFVSAARSEPFGLVIAEAMASGVAVIATRSEGAVEIVEAGVNGLLVPLGDHEALAAAILKLANDDEQRQLLAKNGRQCVVDHFSLEKMVDETESLYKKVAESRHVG